MWKTTITVVPALCLMLSFTSHLRAQTFEFAPIFGKVRMTGEPLGRLIDGNPDTDTHFRRSVTVYGGRFTVNSKGYYGHELTFLVGRPLLYSKINVDDVPTDFQEKVKWRVGSYNFLMYMMPKGEWWRPYITGGAEMTHFTNPSFPGWTASHNRVYGVNYGGGIKFRLGSHALIRLDFRDHINGKPYELPVQDTANSGGKVHHFEGTLGIALTL